MVFLWRIKRKKQSNQWGKFISQPRERGGFVLKNLLQPVHRLGLHAFQLSFQDESSQVFITSDQVPLEMNALLEQDQ
jgi:hypothetical protein